MALGVDLRLGADGSQAQSVLSSLQSKMKDVGNTARNELGQKLKTVFTVAAIEETVRRTAEWSQALQQASKELGISSELMQTFRVDANKAGLSEDSFVNVFQNIKHSVDAAVNGVPEAISAFGKLGIAIDRTGSKTYAQYFDDYAAAINKVGDVNTADMQTRSAINFVTGGTSGNILNDLNQQMGGKTVTDHVDELKAEGKVQDNANIADLSTTWAEFKTTLKGLGTELTPVVTMVVGLLNTLGRALAGVIDLISHPFDMHKWGEKITGAGAGLIKSGTSLTDMLLKPAFGLGNWVNKALGHSTIEQPNLTGMYSESENAMLHTKGAVGSGFNEKSLQQGEAIGETAVMLAPGASEANISKLALKGAGLAEKGGLTGTTDWLLNRAENAESRATGIVKPISVEEQRLIDEAERQKQRLYDLEDQGAAGSDTFRDVANSVAKNQIDAAKMARQRYKVLFGKKAADPGFMLDQVFGEGTAAKYMPKLPSELGVAGLVGAVNSGMTAANSGINKKSNQGENTSPIWSGVGAFQDMGAMTRGSMLSIGNFQGGGFQSRVIALNQQMVSYLAQITKYVGMTAQGYPAANSGNPNTQPSGF